MFSLDELKKANKEKKKIREKNYKRILELIYNKIRLVNETGSTECYYLIPNLIGKNTISDMDDCLDYILKHLKEHAFTEVQVYKPNLVYTSW